MEVNRVFMNPNEYVDMEKNISDIKLTLYVNIPQTICHNLDHKVLKLPLLGFTFLMFAAIRGYPTMIQVPCYHNFNVNIMYWGAGKVYNTGK